MSWSNNVLSLQAFHNFPENKSCVLNSMLIVVWLAFSMLKKYCDDEMLILEKFLFMRNLSKLFEREMLSRPNNSFRYCIINYDKFPLGLVKKEMRVFLIKYSRIYYDFESDKSIYDNRHNMFTWAWNKLLQFSST